MRTRGKRAGALLGLSLGLCLGIVAIEGRAERLEAPLSAWGIGVHDNSTAPRLVVETLAISRGDTLMDLLIESGIARAEAEQAIRALARYYSPRTLQIGQELTIVLDRGQTTDDGVMLLAIGLAVGNGRHVLAERTAGGDDFDAHRGGEPLDVTRIAEALAPVPASTPPDAALSTAGLATAGLGEDDWVLGRLIVAPGAPARDVLAAANPPARQTDVRVMLASQDLASVWRFEPGSLLPPVDATSLAAPGEPSGDGATVAPPGAKLSFAAPGPTAAAFVPRASEVPEDTAVSPRLRPFAGSVVVEKNLRVGGGDTMAGLMRGTGVDALEAAAALDALGLLVSPRDLQIGDRIKVSYQPDADGAPERLIALTLVSAAAKITVERQPDGAFVALQSDSSSPPLPPAAAPKAVAASWQLTSPAKPGATPPSSLVEQAFEIGPGETLTEILAGAGVGDADALMVARALRPLVNLRRLDIGQDVVIVLDPFDIVSGRQRLVGLSIERESGDFAVASRVGGSFEATVAAQPVTAVAALGEAPLPPLPAEPERASDTSLTITLPTLSAIAGRIDMPFVVRKGDTLMTALTGVGVADADATAAIDAIRQVFDPRHLRSGQTVTVAFAADPGERKVGFIGFTVAVEPGKVAEVVRVDATRFRAYERVSELAVTLVRAEGIVHSSLYQAAADAGVASEVMNDLIAALSYDVDFQRDLQDGDRFELLYEVFADDSGAIVRYGSPLYADLEVGGRGHPIYLYAPPGEEPDYFHADGQSVRKALLRTPISGAHVTSSFGKRQDPFLGYTKMHKGIDFGAPKGTPVLAAGDGVVEFAGKFHGYGKYVRIRHSNGYATAYGHLSKYGPGIENGARVRQGQVIGYVGCTGRCTGNHLHYEVLVAGQQVDPAGVDLPTGRKLDGADLAQFFQARLALDRQFAALETPLAVAQRSAP